MNRVDNQRHQPAWKDRTPAIKLPAGDQYSLNLEFSAEIEREYLRDSALSVRQLQRITLFTAAILYGIFLAHDALTIARYNYEWLHLILLGICGPVNVALLLLTFIKKPERVVFRLGWIAALTNSLALIAVSALCFQRGVTFPYEVLMLQQLYNYYLLGLPARTAAPVTVSTVVVFVVTMTHVGMPYADLFEHGFLLTSGALLGCIGCYLHERKRRQAWLNERLYREISRHDPLTGLFNRRSLFEHGEATLRQAQRDGTELAVALMDIDHFKAFNDIHGHVAGDECLRIVSKISSRSAKRPFDCVARYGGEEFCFLFFNVSRNVAFQMAESIRTEIAQATLPIDDKVTVSFGLRHVNISETVTNLTELLTDADEALYKAKRQGRNQVVLANKKKQSIEPHRLPAMKESA